MCCDFSVLVLLAYQQYIIQTPIAECNDRAEVSGGPKSPSRSPSTVHEQSPVGSPVAVPQTRLFSRYTSLTLHSI